MAAPLGRLYDRVRTATAAAWKAYKGDKPETGHGMARFTSGGPVATYGATNFVSVQQQIQAYKSWVYRCVNFIAENASDTPQVIVNAPGAVAKSMMLRTKSYRDQIPYPRSRLVPAPVLKSAATPASVKQQDEYEYADTDDPAVRIFNNPNDPDIGADLWYLCEVYLRLTGVAYLYPVLNGAGDLVELWNMPTQWVLPIAGTTRMIDGYQIWGNNVKVADLGPEDLIRIRYPSPRGPLHVESPTQAAGADIDLYDMTHAARYTAMTTGAHIGGQVVLPPGISLTDEQMDRLESRLMARYAGPTNYGRPLITENGATYIPPPSERELAFMQSQDQLRQYVMAAYGLDQSLMGFSDETTFAGAVENRKRLWLHVLKPSMARRAAVLTEKLLVPYFGSNYAAIYSDPSADDPAQKRADCDMLFKNSALSPNELRVAYGYEPLPDPVFDSPVMPGGSVPAGSAGEMFDPFADKPATIDAPDENGEPSTKSVGQFDESKHPRADDGKFGHGAGNAMAKPAAGKKDDKGDSEKQKVAGRVPEKKPSAKAARAKKAHVMVDKSVQQYAEEYNEPRFAKVMGGASFPDSEPVDVVVPNAKGVVAHGIEMKTMVVGKDDKLTMNAFAQVRKLNWERANKATFHTIVSDDRKVFNAKGDGKHDEKKRVYYYRRGIAGSARVEGMHKVETEAELKVLMNTPDAKLPDGAKRKEKDWLTAGTWEPLPSGERGYKNSATGQIVRPKK